MGVCHAKSALKQKVSEQYAAERNKIIQEIDK